jgi:hypothetical protein
VCGQWQKAGRTPNVRTRDLVERATPDQPEVAVGVADAQAEDTRDEPVVDATDHTAKHPVGAA